MDEVVVRQITAKKQTRSDNDQSVERASHTYVQKLFLYSVCQAWTIFVLLDLCVLVWKAFSKEKI
jgi:L-lactate permease